MSRTKRELKLDCDYIDTEHQKLRPYCEKLNKEIRARDCTDCGWYDTHTLGIGAMMVGDIKRLERKVKE